jgi:hypothetical protein
VAEVDDKTVFVVEGVISFNGLNESGFSLLLKDVKLIRNAHLK